METGREQRRTAMPPSVITLDMFEELDSRANDGIQVSLLWERTDNRLKVVIVETKTDELFELPVQAAEAIDVFRHPFAYATVRSESP
jgi:hypothetical protein